MESLSTETWDAVIAGTSLPQSLLAFALSKCDLKVLHVDKNDYYGGLDAGLSRHEAETWIKSRTETDHLARLDTAGDAESTLGPSRAYTISLKPQIIHAKSRFLPTLVSSQIHSQLEFQAVGSLWVHANERLQKIPSNREDVFADDTISVRDKRRLMSLLRYVLGEQEEQVEESTLNTKLKDQFKLPQNLWAPVQALTLSTDVLSNVQFTPAMARLKLHLTSMGTFGPGMAAVMAKYGGNAEIAQAACRAGAVGGFVYLLGHGITSIQTWEQESLASVTLSDGTTVKTKYIVGSASDLPGEAVPTTNGGEHEQTRTVAHKISIISKPLRHLFTSASENGPVPAVTIVLVDDGSNLPPVYLQVHSEDTGECPSGQCIIYASCLTDDTSTPSSTQERLNTAITNLLSTLEDEQPARTLWSISFSSTSPLPQDSNSTKPLEQNSSKHILLFPPRTHDLAFDDSVLDSVKAAWEEILGARSAEFDFLRFEERRDENDE